MFSSYYLFFSLFFYLLSFFFFFFFFFNDTATTEIYTLSLHDALPILARQARAMSQGALGIATPATAAVTLRQAAQVRARVQGRAPGHPQPPRLRLSAQRPDGRTDGGRSATWRAAASQPTRERPGQRGGHGRRGGLRSLRFGGDLHGSPLGGPGHGVGGGSARGGQGNRNGAARVRFGGRRGDGVFGGGSRGGGSVTGRQAAARRPGASPRFRRRPGDGSVGGRPGLRVGHGDRKSTRLNSSHDQI